MTEYTVQQVDWSGHYETLLAIRFAVFVREQGVPPALEHDEYDATALHLLATDRDGKPVGTVFLALARKGGRTRVVRQCHPRGRIAFKRVVSQAALEMIRRVASGGRAG